MQADFHQNITQALSGERLDSYAADKPSPEVPLARYLLNMALCESLYSPLQLCEVALRNAIHRHLSRLMGREDWYDAPELTLTPWAVQGVINAKDKIQKAGNSVTPPRVVAELHFGFWCGIFEAHYEDHRLCGTPIFPSGIKGIFPKLPKSLHNRKNLKHGLEDIRALRNRVFHHERIVHWTDLNDKHSRILQTIAWISPELHDMALHLDRYKIVRKQGVGPWLGRIRSRWPHPGSTHTAPTARASDIAVVPAPFPVDGEETPFGQRWGGQHFRFDADLLAALTSGRTVALDVQNEYVVFLTSGATGGAR